MKVILSQDVKGKGKKGDLIEVSEGYAQNFLIPKGLAVLGTKGNLKTFDVRKKKEEERQEQAKQDAIKLGEKIKELSVSLTVKSGDNGRLFGSINTKDIADALSKQHNIKVDKHKVELNEAIKSLGHYKIKLKLHKDVTTELLVKISEA